MKIRRTAEGRATISDLSPEEFRTIVDAVADLSSLSNRARPFGASFERFLAVLRLELSEGVKLFVLDGRPDPVAPVYRLRVRSDGES